VSGVLLAVLLCMPATNGWEQSTLATVEQWRAMELADLAALAEAAMVRGEGDTLEFTQLGAHCIERVAAAEKAKVTIEWRPCLEIPMYFSRELTAEMRQSMAAEIERQLGGEKAAGLSDVDAARAALSLQLLGSEQAADELTLVWLKSYGSNALMDWGALHHFGAALDRVSPARTAMAARILKQSSDPAWLAAAKPFQVSLVMFVFRAEWTTKQKTQLAANLRVAYIDNPSVLRSLDTEQFHLVCSAFMTLDDTKALTAAAGAVAVSLVKEARQSRSVDPWASWGEMAGVMRDAASRKTLYTQMRSSDDGSIALAGLLAKSYVGTEELDAWRKTLEADAAKATGDVKARIFMARAMADGVEAQPHLILRGKSWLDRSLGATKSAACRQMILALLIQGYIEAEQFEEASAILNSLSDQFSESPEPLQAMRDAIASGREKVLQRSEQFKREEEAQLLRLRQESLGEQLKKAQADNDQAKAEEIRQILNRLTAASNR